MKFPRVRFTVRRMMVAAAVVAVVMAIIAAVVPWAGQMYRLSINYRDLARRYKSWEGNLAKSVKQYGGHATENRSGLAEWEAKVGRAHDPMFRRHYEEMAAIFRRSAEFWARFEDRSRRQAIHVSRLRRKYERASLLPFLPVAPDEPLPE